MVKDKPKSKPYEHAPYDVEVEQSVIGSLLRDNRQIDIAAADLEGAHFYDPLHGRLFDVIVVLSTEGEVTPLILHSVMKSDPGVIETGGLDYLMSLYNAAPAIPRMREYARILLDLSLRRDLQRIAADLAAAAVSPPSETTGRQAADLATEALLQAGKASAKPVLTIRQIAAESIQEAEDLKHGKPIPMVATPFDKLNREIGGFRGGDMITIMGQPGWGKSALKGSISRHAAAHYIPTIVFSLEMMRRQWVDRMICEIDFDTAEIPMWYSRVRNGRLSDDEFARYILASQKTEGWPFEIHDEDDLTVAQISARARAFAAKHGKNEDGSQRMGLVVVDYLQIIQPTDDKENRERQVARIARGLKSLAKRLNWPVVVGSQMNENGAARPKEERRPQASDARESRAIMNESDLMLAPYRPAVFVERRKPMDAVPGDINWNTWAAELREVRHKMDLLCLKNRHGKTFDVSLFCDMGASAIRDEEPSHRRSREAEDQSAAELLL